MRYREPFTVFPKKLKSGLTIYYYTTYDKLIKGDNIVLVAG